MVSLSGVQVRRLNQAILGIYTADSLSRFPDQVFAAVRIAIPYEVGGLPQLDRTTGMVDGHFSEPEAYQCLARGFPDCVTSFYNFPGVRDGRYFAYGAPQTVHRWVAPQEFEASAFYQGFYRPLGLYHEATLNFDGNASTVTELCLARPRPFTAAEHTMLELLQPHLRLRFRQLLALQPEHPTFARLQPLHRQSWLLCSGAGVVSQYRPEVPGLFARMGWPWQGCLPPEWVSWLQRQLLPLTALRPPVPPLLLPGPRSEVLVHCLVNTRSDQHRLIFLERSRPAQELSRRETEVARWVAEGKTNAIIAELLGISPATVKNHVVSILAKIGGENRAAIATFYWRTRRP